VDDYDSPWKEALDEYFPAFLEFYFPGVNALVNWERGFDSLDTELQQITRNAELGPRRVDKLVRVWMLSGEEAWILIHVEVQSQEEAGFPRRMWVYHYRLFDKFDREIISLAVFGDNNPNWRPNRFSYEHGGCKLVLEFPIAKLLDYESDVAALEASQNPFAVITLAHLKTQSTRRDNETRRVWKLRIVRWLYEGGYEADDIRRLFLVIDWMMELPRDLALSFWNDVELLERGISMPYVTSVERIGIEKGLRKGLLFGIEQALELRFGAEGTALLATIQEISDVDLLKKILSAIKPGCQLEDLRNVMQ